MWFQPLGFGPVNGSLQMRRLLLKTGRFERVWVDLVSATTDAWLLPPSTTGDL